MRIQKKQKMLRIKESDLTKNERVVFFNIKSKRQT